MPQTFYERPFINDLAAQIAYLSEHREVNWLEILWADLAVLNSLLSDYPESGRETDRDGSDVLRKLRLRRAPFYVWYAFDPGRRADAVRLYRLQHTRQKTRSPRRFWP